MRLPSLGIYSSSVAQTDNPTNMIWWAPTFICYFLSYFQKDLSIEELKSTIVEYRNVIEVCHQQLTACKVGLLKCICKSSTRVTCMTNLCDSRIYEGIKTNWFRSCSACSRSSSCKYRASAHRPSPARLHPASLAS